MLASIRFAMFALVAIAGAWATAAFAQQSSVEGYWLGTLQAPGASLRVQLTMKSDAGKLACTLDSLDQNAYGLPCANISHANKDFSFDIPVVSDRWTGTLSEDHKSLQGTWTQGVGLPLTFARQDKPIPPPARPAVTFDPAIAPVDAENMQTVLARDLEKALKSGALAPETSAGVAVGVVRNGVRSVFAFGTAKSDSIFEIGSITKTFTCR